PEPRKPARREIRASSPPAAIRKTSIIPRSSAARASQPVIAAAIPLRLNDSRTAIEVNSVRPLYGATQRPPPAGSPLVASRASTTTPPFSELRLHPPTAP